jgi:Zn-dependent protease with chaperone function
MPVEQGNTEAENLPLIKHLQCPVCKTMLPVYEGCTTWCDQCGWSLEPRELPPPETLFEKLYRSISEKSSQRLFKRMMERRSLEATVTLSKLLAFLMAGCIHGVSLAFLALGIWLSFFAFPIFPGIVFGLPFLGLAWVFLPDVPKLSLSPVSEERFPTLYEVVNRIARNLGGSKIDGIVITMQFNAAFGQYGWRRKRILFLGLPLFSILSGREKVALISHELAHGKNGDPNRNFFIHTAMRSLTEWYRIIHPRNRWRVNAGPATILLLLINLASLPVAGMIWLLGYLFSQLIWYDIQRAEYLADLLAAQVSGTDAQLSVLDKSHLDDVYRLSLKKAYLSKTGQSFFAHFQRRASRMPARELERIRRVEKMEGSRIDRTHPPTAHRVEFLEVHYVSEATVVLSSEELVQLEKELAPVIEEAQEGIFALDDITFRSWFGLSW